MERVAIVAVAQTKFQESRWELKDAELTYEAVKQVMDQTGLTWAEDGTGIDASITATTDHWDGTTISDIPDSDVVGGHLRSSIHLTDDGIHTVYLALAQILSGHYDVVLVCARCKESQASRHLIENAAFDPVYHRLLGLDFLTAAALQARRYMYKYGITPEQCAKVVVKDYKNAKNNPFAQQAGDLTVADVLNSRMLSYPIRLLDAKPTSDGAVSMILANEEKAKKITNKPVWITGAGSCYEGHHLGERDLADCDALFSAAKQAYKMAGIKNPLRQIDVAEVSGDYSYQELLWSEGLGFCDRGEGGKLVDKGVTEMGGRLPVNPSGGVLPGNPVQVAGLARVAEAVLQLRGEAGARQVPKAKTALAHGVTGPCGQLQCVLTLSNQ